MFDAICKWASKKLYEKHEGLMNWLDIRDSFLIALGLYVQHVQSNDYARKMRTAMLWSVTSTLYLWWELSSAGTLMLWNLKLGTIKQENILLVFFVLTFYYTARLCFLVMKAIGFVNPFFLIWPLYLRKKLQNTDYKFNPNNENPPDMWICDALNYVLFARRPALKTEGQEGIQGEMQCADEVRFMVGNPTLGLLENFVFSVLVIPLLCVGVVCWLAVNVCF